MARRINKRFLLGLVLFVGIPLVLIAIVIGFNLHRATGWEEYFRAAKKQLAKEQYFEALVSLRDAFRQGGRGQPEVNYLYAYAALRQSPPNYGEAVFAYRAAVDLDSDYFDAQRDLTELLAKMRQWPDTETEAKRLIDMEPKHGPAYYFLAHALAGQGVAKPVETEKKAKFLEAINVLQEGIKQDPGALALYNTMAEMYMIMQEPEQARQAYELAVKNNPENVNAHLLYAQYLLALAGVEQDKTKAEELLQQASEKLATADKIRPNSAAVYLVMSKAARLRGHSEQAIDYLEKAIKADPKFNTPYMDLAELLKQAGEIAKAEEVLRDGLAKNPDDVDMKISLARFYLDNRNHEAAAPLLAELEKEISEDPLLWPRLKGEEALVEGRPRQAILHLKKALQAMPDDAQTMFMLVQAYRQAGEVGAARDLLQDLLARMPGSSQIREVYATVLLDLDEYQEAERHARMLVMADETNPRLWLLLARAQFGANNSQGALESLQKVIKYDPDNPTPYWMIAIYQEAQKNLTAAEEALKQALATGQSKQTAYANLIAFYSRNRKEQPEAFEERIQALVKEAKKEFPDADWGVLLPATAEARIKYLENRLKENPDDTNSMRNLAQLYSSTGQADKAAQMWMKIYRKEGLQTSAGREAYDTMFSTLLGQDKFDEAAALLNELPEGEPSRVLADAALDLAQKKYEQAALKLEKVVATYDSLSQAHFLLGYAYAVQQKFPNAIESYERALSLRPDYTPARLQLAEILLLSGRFQAAISEASQALKYDPELIQALRITADAQEGLADYTQATKTREQIMALRPNWADNSLRLGRLYDKIGMRQEAQNALESAYKLEPESIPITAELAIFYARTGQRAKGEAILTALVNKHPDNPIAYGYQGNFYRAIAEFQTALATYEKATGLAKVKNEKSWLIGQQAETLILMAQNEKDPVISQKWYEAAFKLYQELATLNPDEPGIPHRLATVQMLKGDLNTALTTIEAALEKAPDDREALVVKAQILINQRRLEKAEEIIRQVLTKNPDYGEAHFQLAEIYLQKKDYQAIINELGKIAPGDPAFGKAMLTLAGVYEKLNRFAEATDSVRRVLRTDPLNFLALMTLAKLYVASGRPAEAETILERLRVERPNEPLTLLQLASAQEQQRKIGAARANYQKAFAMSLRYRAPLFEALGGQVRMMTLLGQGNEAKTLLQNVIRKNPELVEPWLFLTGVNIQLQQWAEAEKVLADAIKTHPREERLYIEQARILKFQDKPIEEVIAAMDKALKKFPQSPQIRVAITILYLEAGRLSQAIQMAQEVAKAAPSADSLLLLGQCYFESKQLENAIEATRKAIALEPAHAGANNNLAYILALYSQTVPEDKKVQTLREARQLADTALKLMAENAPLLDTSAYIYYLQGNYSMAERQLLDSIKLADAALARYHLGLVYEITARPSQAAKEYQKAIEMDPKLPEAKDAKDRLKKLGVPSQ